MGRQRVPISTTKKMLGATIAAGVILALAGCGQAPTTEKPGSDGGDKPAASDFKPCIVSDDGGWNDKSFNESAKNGIDKAADELGVKSVDVESSSESDYGPNIDNLLAQNCTLIISVGFKLSADTIKAATANPDIDFAIIDDGADGDQDGKPDAPNIKPILFDTVQAAYLGAAVPGRPAPPAAIPTSGFDFSAGGV